MEEYFENSPFAKELMSQKSPAPEEQSKPVSIEDLYNKISALLDRYEDWQQHSLHSSHWVHKSGLTLVELGTFFTISKPVEVSYRFFTDQQQRTIADKIHKMAGSKLFEKIKDLKI